MKNNNPLNKLNIIIFNNLILFFLTLAIKGLSPLFGEVYKEYQRLR